VRQPPEMSDRQELSGVWVAQVELTCNQNKKKNKSPMCC